MLSLSFLVALSCGSVLAQTPVPSRPLGYRLQNGSVVVIDAFYDLLSTDCQSNWPVLQKVAAHYPKTVTLTMHMFPMPYNLHAFTVSQVSQMLVSKKSQPSVYSSFLTMMLKNQKDFTVGAVNMTQRQVQQQVAKLVATGKLGLTEAQVLAGFKAQPIYEIAVLSWKYAASRSITGAPEFIINGVGVPNASSFTESDWIKFVDSLLKSQTMFF